jgi:hypothetical protein
MAILFDGPPPTRATKKGFYDNNFEMVLQSLRCGKRSAACIQGSWPYNYITSLNQDRGPTEPRDLRQQQSTAFKMLVAILESLELISSESVRTAEPPETPVTSKLPTLKVQDHIPMAGQSAIGFHTVTALLKTKSNSEISFTSSSRLLPHWHRYQVLPSLSTRGATQ